LRGISPHRGVKGRYKVNEMIVLRLGGRSTIDKTGRSLNQSAKQKTARTIQSRAGQYKPSREREI